MTLSLGAHDPETYPESAAEVTPRWRELLRERLTDARVLQVFGEAVGVLAVRDTTVLHLAVLPGHARRSFGTALLTAPRRAVIAARRP